ncbi:MAG TPA: AglZ/HisF2 family acetamidino modification protein [Pyrinomonadaceae bacterium]|nr:AglZ/HisF2 family acetamidino modification protein [Pyrinomonadaceae bacterium]
MFRPRIIPVLLLKDLALVKSVRFRDYRYIGDPINAVRIFNDLEADELVFLDITASKKKRLISLDFVKAVGEESQMPFSVGGGISALADIKAVIAAGAEKVVLNTCAGRDPDFVRAASDEFGSSTIVVCIDVKRKLFSGERAWILGGSQATRFSPVDFAKVMQDKGAGELIVQSIEKDGTMEGYDIDLIRSIAQAVSIPVVALGGAGRNEDLVDGYRYGFANGLAAGSLFVYQDKGRGVLINYPETKDLSFE